METYELNILFFPTCRGVSSVLKKRDTFAEEEDEVDVKVNEGDGFANCATLKRMRN